MGKLEIYTIPVSKGVRDGLQEFVVLYVYFDAKPDLYQNDKAPCPGKIYKIIKTSRQGKPTQNTSLMCHLYFLVVVRRMCMTFILRLITCLFICENKKAGLKTNNFTEKKTIGILYIHILKLVITYVQQLVQHSVFEQIIAVG